MMQITTSSASRLVIVGGGFWASITALYISKLEPGREILLLGEDRSFGGNTILPVCAAGLQPGHRRILDPLIVKEWKRFSFSCDASSGWVDGRLCLLAAEQLHLEIVEQLRGHQYRLNTAIRELSSTCVILRSGEVIEGTEIIDMRTKPRSSGNSEMPLQLITRDYQIDEVHDLSGPDFQVRTDSSGGIRDFTLTLPLAPNMVRVNSICPFVEGPISLSTGSAPVIANGRMIAESSELVPAIPVPQHYGHLRSVRPDHTLRGMLGGYVMDVMTHAETLCRRRDQSVA